MRRLLALALLFPLGCGGYNWRADVRRHAAVQHGCPEDEVELLEDDGNELSRRVRLDVCGEGRLYQHVNAGAAYEWRDVTGSGEDAAPYVAR